MTALAVGDSLLLPRDAKVGGFNSISEVDQG